MNCGELVRGAAGYLIKFLERILGALTAAPSKLVPVMKIPLIKDVW